MFTDINEELLEEELIDRNTNVTAVTNLVKRGSVLELEVSTSAERLSDYLSDTGVKEGDTLYPDHHIGDDRPDFMDDMDISENELTEIVEELYPDEEISEVVIKAITIED